MTGSTLQMASNYLQWFGSLCIFLFALNRTANKQIEIKIICAYGLISFLFQVLQTMSRFGYSILPRNAVGNIYVFFEVGIFLMLYYSAFNHKKIKLLMIMMLLGYCVLYFITIRDEFLILSTSIRSTRDVIMIICSILYFFFLLKELPSQNLLNTPMFWINAAILFFFSCTFMLSLFSEYIASVITKQFSWFWSVRNFIRVGFCLVICIGVWKARQIQMNESADFKK